MKKQILIAGGILVLILVLAGAAFVAGQLLNAQQAKATGSGPIMKISESGKGDQMFSLQIEPAKELTTLGPPLFKAGLFVRRTDNSIFVGTGAVKLMVKQDQSGKVSTSSDYDGPVVEVVVTHDTTIYRDVTMKQFNGQPAQGQKLQQVLEPGTIDEIGDNSMVQVWGPQNGDRAVASVLVYSLPAFMKKP